MDDLISRKAAIDAIEHRIQHDTLTDSETELLKLCTTDVEALPSATEESFEWCTDCKEYDQEAHCCHRWTKVIRQTVEELKAERNEGHWIDYSDDGFVECPFCHSATNCDDNIDELHFCFSCGAKMGVTE